jgi:hypothetical protein
VGSTAVVTSAVLTYTITAAEPGQATGAGLTGNPAPANPPSAGIPVTFTASGEGGTGSYEYEFQASLDGVNFFVARNYTTDPQWIWATAPGTYHFRANVRSVGSTVAVTSVVLTYTIN